MPGTSEGRLERVAGREKNPSANLRLLECRRVGGAAACGESWCRVLDCARLAGADARARTGASLGLACPGIDIPGWVMTELGVLVAKGDVTVDEFKTALTYVLDNA